MNLKDLQLREKLLVHYKCIEVWLSPISDTAARFGGNAGVSIIGKLQKLQNRAAKLITNSPFDASPLPVIRALGWSTVREIIDLESARIVYKSLNGDAPSYMSDMFTKVNVSTTRSLRNSDYDLRVPFLRTTTTGKRCFSYQGAKLWNGLSKKTKNTSTLKNFMKAIK